MKLANLTRKSSSPFAAAARCKGLSSKLTSFLDQAVTELYAAAPESVLNSRERFHEVAMCAVNRELESLTLSYEILEDIATAIETLELSTADNLPGQFSKVWVETNAGKRQAGVVLRHLDDEVAVFSSLKDASLGEVGDAVQLSHRGASSSVDFEFQLNDLLRLPHAQVLHLGRRTGDGAHDRVNKRLDVEILGFIQADPTMDATRKPLPCKILDLSIGGARLQCNFEFKKGAPLHLDIFLDDGIAEPLSVACTARWSEATQDGYSIGLQFGDLSHDLSTRLETAILKISGTN